MSCDPSAGTCHVCADAAVAGRVVSIDTTQRTATVRFTTGDATVALDLVEVGVGDDVLVHLGFAIGRVGST
jgi:hydrogenase maturation factor